MGVYNKGLYEMQAAKDESLIIQKVEFMVLLGLCKEKMFLTL